MEKIRIRDVYPGIWDVYPATLVGTVHKPFQSYVRYIPDLVTKKLFLHLFLSRLSVNEFLSCTWIEGHCLSSHQPSLSQVYCLLAHCLH
jgi:hypothetical protein